MQIRRRYSRSRLTLMDAVVGTILTLMALLVILPFYNAIMISFVTESEDFRNPFILFPHEPTLEAYTTLLDTGNILAGYGNTLIHIAIGLPISMFITFALGYVLSRPAFPGRRFLYVFVLITMLFSGGMVPDYLNVKSLGLLNSLWALILPGAMSVYNSIICRTAIEAVPDSLEESAHIDGANDLVICFRIILPLIMPTIAVLLLYYGVGHWNSWFPASIYLQDNNKLPIQNVLRAVLIANSNLLNSAAAENDQVNEFAEAIKYSAIVLTTVPVLCIYPFLQRYFVKGVMIGAVKG